MESNTSSVSSQYRTAAGLPERTSDAPTDLTEAPAELARVRGPEGGYGGEDGISNTGTINASEQARHELREEQVEARLAEEEVTGLSGGETATQEALVTESDVTDVKPGPDSVAVEATDEEPVEDDTDGAQ